MKNILSVWSAYKAFCVYSVPAAISYIIAVGAAKHFSIQFGYMVMILAAVLITTGICIFVITQFWTKPSRTFGSAKFAGKKDIKRAGLFEKHGHYLGKWHGKFLRHIKHGHILSLAPTRAGKGVSVVMPNMLTWRGSIVVNDLKGEIYKTTSSWREGLGPVFPIAPFDSTIQSAGFNPIDFIRVGTEYEQSDADVIAEMLVPENPNKSDSHWISAARELISNLVLFVALVGEDFDELDETLFEGEPNFLAKEKKRRANAVRRNLGQVRKFLMLSELDFSDLMEVMAVSDKPVIARFGESFPTKADKELSSIKSTAQVATRILDNPKIQEVTNKSTFDFEKFIYSGDCYGKEDQGVSTLYLIIPPEYQVQCKPFMRLIIGLSMASFTRHKLNPETKEPIPRSRRVLFMLDELTSLGYMEPIETGISYLAGMGVRLWLVAQDLSQLKHTYPKWRSMWANCCVRQVFNVQDKDTAEVIRDMMGQETVQVKSKGWSFRGLFTWIKPSEHFSENVGEAARHLLTVDEIMSLPANKQLLFVQNCRPILADKINYLKDKFFNGRWTPYHIDNIPLIVDQPDETEAYEIVKEEREQTSKSKQLFLD